MDVSLPSLSNLTIGLTLSPFSQVCLMLHPGPSEGLLGMLATAGFIVEFEGHK